MDIVEVVKKKKELEENVLALIQKFEDETGCFVDDQGNILYTARCTMEPNGSIRIPVYVP